MTDEQISTLQHIKALLAEMDLRYQQRFAAQSEAISAAMLAAEKAISAALIAAEKAVTKAETATEKRFEGVNEFRATLQDQAATFISRVEFEALRGASAERMREMGTRLDKIEGRGAGHADSMKNLVTIVGLALTTVTVLVGIWLAFGH